MDMKDWMKKSLGLLAVGLVTVLCFHYSSAVMTVAHRATALSASLLLFSGGVKPNTLLPEEESEVLSPPVKSEPVEEETPSLPATPPKGVAVGSVQTKTLPLSAANTTAEGVHISNKTDLKVNIQEYLNQGLPFTLKDTDQPQVLIVHTHATESYADGDVGYYVKSASTRSTNNKKNTVAVGQEIARVLNQAGIVTINDDTLHDYPNYTGGYTRSADTIRKYLEKYPTIRVVIDGHRDAIGGEDTKVKPTAVINGKKAAQVMILAGCQTGSVEGFPHWEENFRFCLQLQRQLEADYPDLARPLLFKACKYNFDLLNGSILIEIGTDANTLEEATYSAELLGQALVKILQ
jgi:stage II sporulation protein P